MIGEHEERRRPAIVPDYSFLGEGGYKAGMDQETPEGQEEMG